MKNPLPPPPIDVVDRDIALDPVLAPHIARRRRTVILGGGFGGAHVARLLGDDDVTIVNPEGSMLYTPLLPEVAAGAIEPRHVFVPIRAMCPHAELVRGRAVGVDTDRRSVTVETDLGEVELSFERLVVALGSTARMLPIPGLSERAIPFKTVADAIRLRNHVLRRLDAAEADPAHAERALTFVFVGAGYAGVEALAETMQLVEDAIPHFPRLSGVRRRWVLVHTGPRILGEVPDGLGEYAARLLRDRGVEILDTTTLTRVEPHHVELSDGSEVETDTLVWTAGVVANPLVSRLGLPLDERGRIAVDGSLRVKGVPDVYALGDCAAVPNAARGGRLDPPTCQHALRQARALAEVLQGRPRVYGYKSIGEGATLGRDKGIARIFGLLLRGWPASVVTRCYHLAQVPLRSRRVRILADGVVSSIFQRDMVELSSIELPRERPRAEVPEAERLPASVS